MMTINSLTYTRCDHPVKMRYRYICQIHLLQHVFRPFRDPSDRLDWEAEEVVMTVREPESLGAGKGQTCGSGLKWFMKPYLKIESAKVWDKRNSPRYYWKATNIVSVKKIAPLLGCIFTSFSELNWRPWILSKIVVELYGGRGLTRATWGGKCARPEPTNKIFFPNGVPPLTICTGGSTGTWKPWIHRIPFDKQEQSPPRREYWGPLTGQSRCLWVWCERPDYCASSCSFQDDPRLGLSEIIRTKIPI